MSPLTTNKIFQKLSNSPIISMIGLLFIIILLGNCWTLFLDKENPNSLSYQIFIQPMINYLTFMQNNLHIQTSISIILLTITIKSLLSPFSLYGRLHPSLSLKTLIIAIQLPVLNALYFLTTKSEAFQQQTLFHIALERQSFTLSLLIALGYLINNLIVYQFNTIHLYYEKSYQQRILATATPLFMFLVCQKLTSGIAIYFFVSILISLIETSIYVQKKTC